MTFEHWLERVDFLMIRHFGFSRDDVEDWAYDNGFSGNPDNYQLEETSQ